MNLIGRYQGVRGWNGRDLTAPYIIDRKWGRLIPMAGDEWWRSPDGVWIPTVAGGVGFLGAHTTLRLQFPPIGQGFTPTFTTQALSSAYVAGTSGAAIQARWIWPATVTLTDLYVYVTAYTGTAANVDDLNWEVRSGTATAVTTTGGALVGSGSVNPSSATGWIHIASGQSLSLTGGTYYYFIVGDTDGNGTDFATVNRNASNQWPGVVNQSVQDYEGYSTTNGWTARTQASLPSSIVAVFSNGTTQGMPFVTTAASTSSTNRRGYYFSAGLNAPLTIWGMFLGSQTTQLSGAEFYFGSSTVPGTSPTTPTQTLTSDGAGVVNGVIFAPSQTIPAATPARAVYTYSGATTNPAKINIGTGADANLRLAGAGAGSIYFAEANGTTNWANDDTNALPVGVMLIDDQVAPAAAGGLVRANMSGGVL